MARDSERTKLKLKEDDQKLNTILEVTNAVNNNFSAEKLFKLFEIILIQQLGLQKLMVFIRVGDVWERPISYHCTPAENELVVDPEMLSIKKISITELQNSTRLKTFDVAIPVSHKKTPLAYLLLGDLDQEELKMSPIIKHLRFIQTIANIIVVAIENKRLARENIINARLEKELELAKEMQSMLIPHSLPNTKFFQTAAYYRPHNQVGGDYYDFIKLDDENYAFCLADISGKGMSGALLMANFQAQLRTMVRFNKSLTDIAHLLNKSVFENTQGEKFITLFLAKYNTRSRILNYVNAAHNPPLLREAGEYSWLDSGCVGIGMLEEIPSITEGLFVVPEDSFLVAFTDGLTETENNTGEVWDEDHLKSIVAEHKNQNMNELLKTIMNSVDSFRGKKDFHDDVAVLSVRFL